MQKIGPLPADFVRDEETAASGFFEAYKSKFCTTGCAQIAHAAQRQQIHWLHSKFANHPGADHVLPEFALRRCLVPQDHCFRSSSTLTRRTDFHTVPY